MTSTANPTRRRLFIDTSPLRRSFDLRALVAGQLVSVLGTQMAATAVPFEVYALTHSSLDIGLVSLATVVPLLAGSVFGGLVVDAVDRRRLLIAVSALMAVVNVGLAFDAGAAPALWPLFVGPAVTAGLSALEDSALNAVVPNLVRLDELPTANAMFQAVFQLSVIAGPALGGLLLAETGARIVFWINAANFAAATTAALAIAPQRPAGRGERPGVRSFLDGVRFLRGRPAIQGAFAIDINATILGMPRALFPAFAATVFHGGATTLGALYAAPGAGALLGALTTGWVGRVERQGRAVIIAVVVWGLAIAGFGVTPWLPGALALLALAGWADVVSSVFRSTIVQLSVPDALRGRLTGLQIAVVNGGPRLGDLEAGAVATTLGPVVSVVSGGLGCVAGAVALAGLLPGFRGQRAAMGRPKGSSEEKSRVSDL
ncbi:MFS transporter [Nocardia sp. NPDC046763]|uniref:MFS transporter n=1 Tax=Nocardia sp. NPDC046763 TaxID=3155256 RepID=UPI0034052DBD